MLLSYAGAKLEYHGIIERRSKTGAPYYMVELRDIEDFEKYTFFKRDDLEIPNIAVGTEVHCMFKLSKRGFNVNTDLLSMKPIGQGNQKG